MAEGFARSQVSRRGGRDLGHPRSRLGEVPGMRATRQAGGEQLTRSEEMWQGQGITSRERHELKDGH